MTDSNKLFSKPSFDTKFSIKISKVEKKDIPKITEIYNWYIVNSIATYSIARVENDYFQNQFTVNNFPFFVAKTDLDSKLIGFCYASKFRPRQGYDRSLEVSIYLDKDYVNCGIGSLLMSKLTSASLEIDCKCLIAVTGSQLQQTPDSYDFYIRNGFKLSGTLPYSGYKFNQWLDTVIFSKVLN